MLAWLVEVSRVLRGIRIKAQDALNLIADDDPGLGQVKKYIDTDLQRLIELISGRVSSSHLTDLRRHIHFGEPVDFHDIIQNDLPGLQQDIEAFALRSRERELERRAREDRNIGFEDLLHPVVEEAGWPQFLDGHLRDAVLNSFIAVFEQLRERTGLSLDGSALVTEALSANNPYLVLSELDNESGENDQIGFMQIFQGAYRGIRNPKAHSLRHDLDDHKAAQYLVFASLLARRIDEAILVKAERDPE